MTGGTSASVGARRLGVITRDPPHDLVRSYGRLGLDDVMMVISGPDEAELVRLLAPQTSRLGMRFTCIVESDGLEFLLGILDSGVDGVCLRDPPDGEALLQFVRACRYPPRGTRGVATGRDLGYGLDDEVLRRALSDGGTTAIGVALSVDDATAAEVAMAELAEGWAQVVNVHGGAGGTVAGLDFVALWATAPDGDVVRVSEDMTITLRSLASEVHLWGDVTGPPARAVHARAWDEVELLRKGLCDARRR